MKREVTLDSRLKHLTQKEIENLITDYYNDVNVESLINYYKIDIYPSRLYTILPPKKLKNLSCLNCGGTIVEIRKSKSAIYPEKNIYCINCGHNGKNNCKCCYCKNERAHKKRMELQKLKLISEKKKDLINNIFDLSNRRSISFEELSLTDITYLGALLRGALSENDNKIVSLESREIKFSPSSDYNIRILKYLANKELIIPCPNSDLDSFILNEDDSISYYVNKVNYNINLEDCFYNVINPDIKEYNRNEAISLWKEIALEEILEIFNYEMKKTGFNFNPGKKTILTFKDLLENFSVGQIYSIIWKQIANASKWYSEGGVTKKHAANSVVSNCQRFGERAINNSWDLKNYLRPRECEQSIISQFYFNRILKIEELGFNLAPNSL